MVVVVVVVVLLLLLLLLLLLRDSGGVVSARPRQYAQIIARFSSGFLGVTVMRRRCNVTSATWWMATASN